MPPCGGHPVPVLRIAELGCVSSRAPVWGASCPGAKSRDGCRVSSRAPVWGASSTRAPMGRSKLMFQVVPPCGGHPGAAGIPWCGSDVSSRAPVWGASVLAGFFCLWVLVSSRAPVWGASRTLLAWRRLMVVSSRAPVWGASIFCWLSPT